MTTPALLLQLSDARALVPTLSDARALVPTLSDARALVPALSVAELPEPGVGGVMVVPARVPMLTVSGTPPRRTPVGGAWQASSWTTDAGSVVAVLSAVAVGETPAIYTPGPDHVPAVGGADLVDVLRATDSLGATADARVFFRDGQSIPAQALEVAIDTDGIAALYAGGELALTATGGTGPYTWDIVTNASGATLTPEGAYVAGQTIGIDRLRVTDSLGAIGLVQAEVLPGDVAAVIGGTDNGAWGHICLPWAYLRVAGGTAPYTVSVVTDATGGAAVVQGKNSRAQVQLKDDAGAAIDLTGWTFEATLYSQRGAVLAADLAVAVTGTLLEVDLPDPSTLPLTPAVLHVTATTAGATLALGYPTTAIEVLLLAEES